MGQRIDLQQELQDLIGTRSDGKQNVYFQPPESVKLVYPCIIYHRSNANTIYADGKPYGFTKRYDVQLITKDPDSDLMEKLLMAFPMISLSTSFASDGLNHDNYILYY